MQAEMVPCKFCGEETPMTGTRLCDNCWELLRAARSLVRRAGSRVSGRAILLAAVGEGLPDPGCKHGEEMSFTPISCFDGDVYICACGAWYDLYDSRNASRVTKTLSHKEIVSLILRSQREAARRALSELDHTIRAKIKSLEG